MLRRTGISICLVAFAAAAQPHGSIERIKIHAKNLEGNLEGDSPDRDIYVYLPPSYKTDTARRYPVIYMLHGFTDSAAGWMGAGQKHWIKLPEVIDKALPHTREMIVVMPEAFTKFQGSMYSNSATTGDWEDFVAQELVAYIDTHYRTIARPAARGLSGHSMGGYGTIRIAMKKPGVFSSIYALSACCLAPPGLRNDGAMTAESVHRFEEIPKADFITKAMLASAAAWSPNPTKPPLYIDLLTVNGEVQPMVAARWAANAPLAMLDQYVVNLRKLTSIAFDGGTNDHLTDAAKQLHEAFDRYKLPHTFEVYEGDHVNRIAQRIATKVFPYFSEKLARE